ncbi:phage shock protein operon transcriptional activator [Thermodesulfobacteriota bacterium]
MQKEPYTHIHPLPSGIPAGKPEALGHSEVFLEFQESLSRVAPIDRPVLLLGERGTGKELAASRLHYLSERWNRPMVALNCSALSPSLIEAELFGHEKGAFTGAGQRRSGRFEAADEGTLFLDEIGNIPMEVQEKILRVVEYGAFERVGSSASIEVNVRIVAATNADLMALAAEGLFKRDLLDRLSFEVLLLPPLRERQGDIPLLANHFASRMAFELGREEIPRFSNQAMNALEQYAWPGNVRELKNVVERATYRSDTVVISDIVFDPFLPSGHPLSQEAMPDKEKGLSREGYLGKMPLKKAVRELELRLLKEALEEARHHQRKAATILGLSYHQFRGLYRKYSKDLI